MGNKRWTLELVRGALTPKKLYWLKDENTPYDISGATAKLRIKHDGSANEIEVTAPIVQVTDGLAGEITIDFDDATVDNYTFEYAEIALQLDNRILQTGVMRIRNFYD